MCSCDERVGRTYLSHQLDVAQELETGVRVAVTLGFKPNICSECRGLPADNFPMASIPGRTSKIKRYYSREITFATFDALAALNRNDPNYDPITDHSENRKSTEKEVLEKIKLLHSTSPKYSFDEPSQAEILKKYEVEIINVEGAHVRVGGEKRIKIRYDSEHLNPEEFAQRHFEENGYKSILTESVPFHVLFGNLMWMIIQDPKDKNMRSVGFGRRNESPKKGFQDQIWTTLPDDFGKKGYGIRRKKQIAKYLKDMPKNREELFGFFDMYLDGSENLRQYLWAHRGIDIKTAEKLIEILPPLIIVEILQYLADDYWQRFCGWPDMLVYNDDEYFFVEVKSSGDKLSDDQKKWIVGNYDFLKLPFKLFKIHKISKQRARE